MSKKETLCDKLNDFDRCPRPKTDGGNVVALVSGGEKLTNDQLEELGLDPNNLGCVGEHPEGADRGGYVPFLHLDGKAAVYFSETDGEWVY